MELKNFIQLQVSLFTLGAQTENLDIEGFVKMVEDTKLKVPAGTSEEARLKAIENMDTLKTLAEAILPFKAAFKVFAEKAKAALPPEKVEGPKVDAEKVDQKESDPK